MINYFKKNWEGILISVLLAELIGITSSLLSGPIKSIYDTLIKPPLSPPDWIFGIVWPILYALMGIAAYIIFKSDVKNPDRKKALTFYSLQLLLNFIWSIAFFRFNLLWGSVLIILLLNFSVVMTIKTFNSINRTAAKLLIPYLIWIFIATYLNVGIAFLN